MLTIRLLMFITLLPTPALALAATGLPPYSLLFPVVVASFAVLSGLLIASTTTRIRNGFFRKFMMSSVAAAAYFLMLVVVPELWSHEGPPASSVALLVVPIHGMAAVASAAMLILAVIALAWLAMKVEVSRPALIRRSMEWDS